MTEFAAMKQMLLEQQAELASLREALAQKQANRPGPTVTTPAPQVQLKTPDPSRRTMLKRMGLAVLAGGAALGITSATYAPAEARIIVNPTSNSNVGAIITRNGASTANIPTNYNFGLVAYSDMAYNPNNISLPPGSSGVLGVSSERGVLGVGSTIGVYGTSYSGNGVYGESATSRGVYGYSAISDGVYGTTTGGYGVYGTSANNVGVYGTSTNGKGMYGETGSSTNPAISAKNNGATSGIALQIEQGGITVKNAGIGAQTFAFIHQTTPGNTTTNYTRIDNPFSNGRPNAMVFVTYNYNAAGSGNYLNKVLGVFYDSGTSKWCIALEDVSFISTSVTYYFNVLIINP